MYQTPEITRWVDGAAYARYSTDKQCSTEVQFAVIKKFSEAHGIRLSPAHMYEDRGESGTNTNREQFGRMLAAARNHEFSCIVVYDLTRGSRDVVDWFSFRKEMQRIGIQVYSATEQLGRLDDPGDFLRELITVGIGQSHVLTSRSKSMDSIDMRAAQGQFLGGYAPYGYRIEDGHYIIVEQEAEVIRTVFAMYAAGKSFSDILEAIPSGIRGRRGRTWGKNTIHYILKNERYAGKYSWCKRQVKYMSEWAGGGPSDRAVEIDGIIPAIVDKETWERVVKRMTDNRHNKTNNSRKDREYLLSGLMRCGHCGSALVGVTTTNTKGYEYKFYTCSGKRQKRTCKAKNIAANDIEPLIVSLLTKSLTDGSMIEATADAILAAGDKKNSASDRPALTREMGDIQAQIDNLIKVLSTGLDSQSVREKVTELEAKKRAIEEKIQALRSPTKTLSRDYLIQQLSQDAARVVKEPDCMKELIRKYIVQVDVYDDQIIIHSVADLSTALPIGAEQKESGYSADGDAVTATGCGGQI